VTETHCASVRKDLRCQTGAWGPIEPQRIFGALSNRLRSRAVPSHDPTDFLSARAAHFRFRGTRDQYRQA
jgi:hypothetical protein